MPARASWESNKALSAILRSPCNERRCLVALQPPLTVEAVIVPQLAAAAVASCFLKQQQQHQQPHSRSFDTDWLVFWPAETSDSFSVFVSVFLVRPIIWIGFKKKKKKDPALWLPKQFIVLPLIKPFKGHYRFNTVLTNDMHPCTHGT